MFGSVFRLDINGSHDPDLWAFSELYRGDQEITAERDGFGIHNEAYYEAAHRLFVTAGQGRLLLAEHGGQRLAGLVAFAVGETACYMYGASSSEGLRGFAGT